MNFSPSSDSVERDSSRLGDVTQPRTDRERTEREKFFGQDISDRLGGGGGKVDVNHVTTGSGVASSSPCELSDLSPQPYPVEVSTHFGFTTYLPHGHYLNNFGSRT